MNPVHLKQLKDSPDWGPVRKGLIEAIPEEMPWSPGKDEECKFRSSFRQGYLNALSMLGIHYE